MPPIATVTTEAPPHNPRSKHEHSPAPTLVIRLNFNDSDALAPSPAPPTEYFFPSTTPCPEVLKAKIS
jgi:hypothetical protein